MTFPLLLNVQLSVVTLWSPDLHSRIPSASEPQNLNFSPPSYSKTLDKFYIELNPQTQHRTRYSIKPGTPPGIFEDIYGNEVTRCEN